MGLNIIEKIHNNEYRGKLSAFLAFFGGVVLGIIFFMVVYGYPTLDVTNDAYIINEGTDLPGFFIVWDGYRYAGWSSDGIGMFNTLTYPEETSYVIQDQVPLLGLFFKIISPILPENFQYAGIWGLMCYALQGGLGALLIYKYAGYVLVSVFCSIPFIIATPVMSKLFYHHAQGGQWVILVALTYWVYNYEKEKSLLQEIIAWALIGLMTVGVNIYAVPMVGMVFVGYSVMRLIQNKKNVLKICCSLVSYLLTIVAFIAIMGGFQTGFVRDDSFYEEYLDRLHRCGANLNAFYNSVGVSKFLYPLTWAKDGQGEGFAYLGLGMLIAVCAAIFLIIYRIICKHTVNDTSDGNGELTYRIDKTFEIGMAVTFILSIIAALGPVVSIEDKILFEIPYPDFILRFWCNFRSTGRMIWPAFYIVFVFVYRILYSVNTSQKKLLVTIFLAFCCIIQVADLSNYIKGKHNWFDKYQKLNTPIKDSAWEYLGENYEHMVVLPNLLLNRSDERNVFAKIAVDYDLTLNDYYLARQNLTDQTDEYKKQFADGNIDDNTFYVIKWYELNEFIDYDLNWYVIDGNLVGTKADITDSIHKDEIEVDVLRKYQQEGHTFVWDGLDYNVVFDPIYYYYSYSDEIDAASDDYDAIFKHFIDVGMKEGKRASDAFNPVVYRKSNQDLKSEYSKEWEKYYKHYIEYGMAEGRKCS